MLSKCYTQYASKFGKLSSGHRTGKGQFSFQSQRKAMLKNAQSESESEVAQSCPTLRHPMDCSLPGSSIHGIFQARVVEWGAIAFSEECSNYCTIALISHTSKVMLKVLQARLQQYVNRELPDVQAGFRKIRGIRDQIANIKFPDCYGTSKFHKNIYLCFIDYPKAFDCVDHNQLWKILNEMGISDHLTCLLRNLYAVQEATVRTGHGTTDCFQIGKEVMSRLYIVTCLFNLCTLHIMRNARLNEAQARIKLLGEISITSDMQ